jgi:hypothetical protein
MPVDLGTFGYLAHLECNRCGTGSRFPSPARTRASTEVPGKCPATATSEENP